MGSVQIRNAPCWVNGKLSIALAVVALPASVVISQTVSQIIYLG